MSMIRQKTRMSNALAAVFAAIALILLAGLIILILRGF